MTHDTHCWRCNAPVTIPGDPQPTLCRRCEVTRQIWEAGEREPTDTEIADGLAKELKC